MPRKNTALYTVIAVVITLYALWNTGYDIFLFIHAPIWSLHRPAFPNQPSNVFFILQPIGLLMNIMVWWVITALCWLLCTDYTRRAP